MPIPHFYKISHSIACFRAFSTFVKATARSRIHPFACRRSSPPLPPPPRSPRIDTLSNFVARLIVAGARGRLLTQSCAPARPRPSACGCRRHVRANSLPFSRRSHRPRPLPPAPARVPSHASENGSVAPHRRHPVRSRACGSAEAFGGERGDGAEEMAPFTIENDDGLDDALMHMPMPDLPRTPLHTQTGVTLTQPYTPKSPHMPDMPSQPSSEQPQVQAKP